MTNLLFWNKNDLLETGVAKKKIPEKEQDLDRQAYTLAKIFSYKIWNINLKENKKI